MWRPMVVKDLGEVVYSSWRFRGLLVHSSWRFTWGATHARCPSTTGWCGTAAWSPLPQGDDQADQVDPQPLLTHDHAVQLRRWHTAASAKGAGAGHIDMLGYFYRNLGQVNHFPSALGPTTGQLGAAVGTLLYYMLHPLGGRHAGAGKAVRPGLAWFLGLGRPLTGFGLQTGHPA